MIGLEKAGNSNPQKKASKFSSSQKNQQLFMMAALAVTDFFSHQGLGTIFGFLTVSIGRAVLGIAFFQIMACVRNDFMGD